MWIFKSHPLLFPKKGREKICRFFFFFVFVVQICDSLVTECSCQKIHTTNLVCAERQIPRWVCQVVFFGNNATTRLLISLVKLQIRSRSSFVVSIFRKFLLLFFLFPSKTLPSIMVSKRASSRNGKFYSWGKCLFSRYVWNPLPITVEVSERNRIGWCWESN